MQHPAPGCTIPWMCQFGIKRTCFQHVCISHRKKKQPKPTPQSHQLSQHQTALGRVSPRAVSTWEPNRVKISSPLPSDSIWTSTKRRGQRDKKIKDTSNDIESLTEITIGRNLLWEYVIQRTSSLFILTSLGKVEEDQEMFSTLPHEKTSTVSQAPKTKDEDATIIWDNFGEQWTAARLCIGIGTAATWQVTTFQTLL